MEATDGGYVGGGDGMGQVGKRRQLRPYHAILRRSLVSELLAADWVRAI